MTKTAVVLAMSLVLAGCADAQKNPKQTLGSIVGAGLGAVAGAQFGKGAGRSAAVAIGTLAGAYMGGEVGRSLDDLDRMKMRQTTQSALERNRSGVSSSWRNPDSGRSGTVTPVRSFQTADRRDCRDYRTTVTIDGKTEQALGRACRESDGTWRIQN